jgi:hypothetical protein
MSASRENLKVIWFEGEMLPNWAQMLDAAARLCPVSEETRSWFSRLTNSSGVDDARTIIANAETLQHALRENRKTITTQLQRTRGDGQANQIFAAWQYALETMIQEAASRGTCSWKVEGVEDTGEGDFGDGGITLRRV